MKGGCGLYIKNSITTVPRSDLNFKITAENAECETFWTEIKNGCSQGVVIGVIYRHPSNPNELFFRELEKTLKMIKKEGKNLPFVEISIPIF